MGNQVAIVEYHHVSGKPLFCADVTPRDDYYNPAFNPNVWVDGVHANYPYDWDIIGKVRARLTIASPLDITFTSCAPGEAVLYIKNVSSSNFSGTLHCAVIENSLPAGGKTWNWVTRDMVPDGNGVPLTLAAGASTTLTKSYTMNSSWVQGNLWVVVFAQESTKNVVQAQKCKLATGPSITLTSPKGGEVWDAGTSQQITWSTSSISSGDVALEYSTNNGTSWNTIGTVTYNASPYLWTIPNTPSTNCKVKISQETVTGTSGSVFTIQPSASTDFDTNGDGAVNFTDVTFLSHILAGISATNGREDVNKDGVFNVSDLTLEIAKVVGLF